MLVAVKCKPCEIYWRMSDMYRKNVWDKKMLTNGLDMSLPLQAWVKNTVEMSWLFDKEKFPGAAVSK